jgi:CRISPR-associated protein Cas1
LRARPANAHTSLKEFAAAGSSEGFASSIKFGMTHMRRDGEDCLLVQIPERRAKDGVAPSPARKERVPLIKIDEVVVLGEVTLTASAMHLLLEHDIEITFLGHYGQFKGRLSPSFSKNAVLRLAQYRAHQDMTKRCELARRFVVGKLTNQRTMLQRYNRRQSDAEMRQAIEQMGGLLHQLSTLPLEQVSVAHKLASGGNRIASTPLETILGMEGAGSAAYFRCFGKLLSNPKQWPFPGRVKRPATDPVNSLLSFGYSLLTNKVASAVQLVGFDHFVGYLHSAVYGRPALALDLVEEFRPIIVDSVVLTLLNNRMFTVNDFVVELGAYRLKDESRKVFFTKFEERLNEEINHPVFGYQVTYRRCIELQARLLAKFVTGEIEEYVPFFIK